MNYVYIIRRVDVTSTSVVTTVCGAYSKESDARAYCEEMNTKVNKNVYNYLTVVLQQ
jgi:hypothetical protein